MAAFEVITEVSAKDGFGLFAAESTRFKPITNFATIGCGGDLAHYICADVHSNRALMERCVPLAAHMLEQVKENIPGCGGDSYIATLTRKGAAQLLQRPEADEIGKHLATGEQYLKQMLVASGDLTVDDKKFRYLTSAYSKALLGSRKELRKSKEDRQKKLDKHIKRLLRGRAGTPTPSVSQKSE